MTEKTRRLTLLRELVVSGGVGAGQHLAIDDVVRVASDAGLRYSSRDNLYSDLDMLASEELVSCVKPGNAGCILVTIRPKAIALVEEMTETESRGSETLSWLVLLYDQRHKLLKDGPNSESAIAWFAEIGSLLQAVDPAYAESFHELSGYLTLPLSTYSLGPVWNQIQQIIMESDIPVAASLRFIATRLFTWFPVRSIPRHPRSAPESQAQRFRGRAVPK